MAEIEEPQFSSVKERIAALKLQQVGLTPSKNADAQNHISVINKTRRPPPPPPPPPATRPIRNKYGNPSSLSSDPLRSDSSGITVRRSSAGSSLRNGQSQASVVSGEKCPALPPRRPPTGTRSPAPPPPLPARQRAAPATASSPSTMSLERDVIRKSSLESVSSVRSGRSSLSTRSVSTANTGYSGGEQNARVLKVPAFNPSTLPSLLPSNEERAEDAQVRGALLMHAISDSTVAQQKPDGMGVRSNSVAKGIAGRPPLPGRSISYGPKVGTAANTVGFDGSSPSNTVNLSAPPPLPPSRLKQRAPPSVPIDRRIPISAPQDHLQPSARSNNTASGCLLCRDFSAADSHAAQFPRSTVPGGDLGWLAHQLTAPFSSLTDKARVIFTWMHHNIAYDTAGFFAGDFKSSTPATTFETGLAVCEGYSNLYADIAAHAGLECLVIDGHSKGFGHKPLPLGSPVPIFDTNHAWTAVRIDDGQWKLIDSTWGAGAVDGQTMQYEKKFDPSLFTMDNNEFGLKHFPTNKTQFFRENNQPAPSWESYILADVNVLTTYAVTQEGYGLDINSFTPAEKYINLSQHTGADTDTIRFQFSKVCPHWTSEGQGLGKPRLFFLRIGEKDYIPFESDEQLYWSWIDISVGKLCDAAATMAEGEKKIHVAAVTRFGDGDGLGLTADEFTKNRRRMGISYSHLAEWMIA